MALCSSPSFDNATLLVEMRATGSWSIRRSTARAAPPADDACALRPYEGDGFGAQSVELQVRNDPCAWTTAAT